MTCLEEVKPGGSLGILETRLFIRIERHELRQFSSVRAAMERMTGPPLTLILCLALLLHCGTGRRRGDETKEDQRQRQGRVFSLFSIVSFDNAPCRSTSTSTGTTSTFRNGTCFTSNECSSNGGTVAGSCASGFGVCCVFVVSNAATTISQNCTYIQNPGFPTPLTSTNALQYTIAKCSPGVCSLRLDFETFNLLGPAGTAEANGGVCRDTFAVTTATNQRIPTICGQNSGQHIYVDMGAAASDTVNLAFTFTGTSNQRQWEIKVSQIPCGANYRQPTGCLQYVTGLTGRLTTFNFLDATGSSHLANQQYTQCIRQEAGFCCVQYQPCTDANSFSIDQTLAAAGMSRIDSQCTLDFVSIQGASGTCSTTPGATSLVEKLCGNFFSPVAGSVVSSAVCDCTAPFEVGIVTDGLADANSANQNNRGVCLTYMQVPC